MKDKITIKFAGVEAEITGRWITFFTVTAACLLILALFGIYI